MVSLGPVLEDVAQHGYKVVRLEELESQKLSKEVIARLMRWLRVVPETSAAKSVIADILGRQKKERQWVTPVVVEQFRLVRAAMARHSLGYALVRLADASIENEIIGLIDEFWPLSDWGSEYHLIEALYRMKTPRADRLLIRMIEEEVPGLVVAIEGVAVRKLVAARPIVEKCLQSDNPDVRAASKRALKRLGNTG